MGPDYLFLFAAFAAGLLAVSGLLRSIRSRSHRLSTLFWVCLTAGLSLQGLAPNLEVQGHFFVVNAPTDSTARFSPRAIVERERSMHLLSALLTGTAALGLALCYRELLTRPGHSAGS